MRKRGRESGTGNHDSDEESFEKSLRRMSGRERKSWSDGSEAPTCAVLRVRSLELQVKAEAER